MNYKMITKLGIKLIALFFFMQYFVMTISSVITVFDVMGQTEVGSLQLLSAFTPMVLMTITSILVWVNADKIADKLVGDMESQEIVKNIDYNRIQIIAFGVAGILVVCDSLPDMFNTIYQIITMPKQPMNLPNRIVDGYVAKLIGNAIKTILGLWLILGAKGIVNMIKKLRTAGTNYESQKDEQIN